MKKNWHKISLAFFLCIALIGTLLRAMPLLDLPANYSFLLHAHSHLAFQGWIYTMILLLIPKLFLSPEQILKSKYPLQFKLTVPLLICILISFSFEGYSILSIILSTLFQVLTYWFIFRFFKDTSGIKSAGISISFVRTGFWFSLLSSIAPYFVGVLSAKNMQDSEFYEAAIYFFLHFQYNGWFIFTVLGIAIKILETKSIPISSHHLNLFLKLMTVSTVLLYCHSLLGMSFGFSVFIPSFIGASLQLFASFILAKAIRGLVAKKSGWVQILIYLALLGFFIKVILQLFSHIPSFLPIIFTNRSLIMAYMHLCLIGIISFSFLAFLLVLRWMNQSILTRAGLVFLLSGYLLSELYLLLFGLGHYFANESLVIFSMMMALGIFLMLVNPNSNTAEPKTLAD